MRKSAGIPAALSLLLLVSCDLPLASGFDLASGGAEGIRIAHVTDLHLREATPLMDRLVEKLNGLRPDLIVFTGDLVESPEGLPLLYAYLDALDASVPKYAILGNWEYKGRLDVGDYRTALAAHGVTLLVNEPASPVIKTTMLNILGLDDYLEGDPSFAGYAPASGALNIVLGHCPALFHELVSTFGPDAEPVYMFSGHTHGGQITLFGIPIYLPPGSGGFCSGRYGEGNHTLFVSRGIGNQEAMDFRLFSDPEFMVYSF